jgi:opacity protein-like surface antigen
MNIPHLTVALCALALATSAHAADAAPPQKDAMSDCPMHAQHMSAAAANAVDERGDKGMGFSHMKTTHHFRIFSDGGAIEVTATDPTDEASLTQIRGHLAHIAQAFTAGNFDTPRFVHGRMPSGAAVMQQMKTKIRYSYEQLETGGRVRITTSDAKAITAVHEFLRFQINEHRTGDPLEIAAH